MLVSPAIAILGIHIRQAFFHKKSAIATVLSWGVRVALTIFLYHGIYRLLGQQHIKGISLDIAVSSMILYAIFCGFGGREVFRLINQEYKQGAIEIWFNKPISYLMMKMIETFARDMPAALGLLACAALFWGFNGLPDVNATGLRLLSGIPLLFCGIIIAYLLYSLIGLCAIWLEDATPLFAITDKLIMVLGGAYIPIGFFPEWFRFFGESLPVGATNYVSQIFYPDFFDNLPRFIAIQAFWILALFFSLRQLNKAAYTRITVNGG